MANRRSIAKSISISEQVDGVSDQAALLFSWMFPHADDFGRLPGSAKKLGAVVVPLRMDRKPGWAVDDIEGYIMELEEARDEAGVPLIYRYRVGGIPVIQLIKFDSHQEGLHKRTRSKFPDPEEPFPEIPGNSGKVQEIPGSRARGREGKGNEGKRNEGKGREQTGQPPTPPVFKKGIYEGAAEALSKVLTDNDMQLMAELSLKYEPDFILEALRRARARGKPRVSYAGGIISDWVTAGLTTLDAVIEADPPQAGTRGNGGVPPDDGQPRAAPNEKRRQESIRAACDYIKLELGPDPPRELASQIAAGYGEDLVPDILERLYEGGTPP